MDPIDPYKQAYQQQLLVTLRVLTGHHPWSQNKVAIAAASSALTNWLQTIPDPPPPSTEPE